MGCFMGNVSNSIITDLKNYAESIVDDRHTPAVSLAVWKDGQLYQGAAGILNLKTGVEATADSIFQIGSITKVFTTCLVMQLVDEGRVELDAPVKRYLRDFQIAERQGHPNDNCTAAPQSH